MATGNARIFANMFYSKRAASSGVFVILDDSKDPEDEEYHAAISEEAKYRARNGGTTAVIVDDLFKEETKTKIWSTVMEPVVPIYDDFVPQTRNQAGFILSRGFWIEITGDKQVGKTSLSLCRRSGKSVVGKTVEPTCKLWKKKTKVSGVAVQLVVYENKQDKQEYMASRENDPFNYGSIILHCFAVDNPLSFERVILDLLLPDPQQQDLVLHVVVGTKTDRRGVREFSSGNNNSSFFGHFQWSKKSTTEALEQDQSSFAHLPVEV
eukprot:CAMPEP_0174278834 /NCGR_PEP_ID=MMETSP0439-20130205/61695_1 /TAXON_ID=0 /ORGANISM="Stereomyxa ramosa, Strain Chinc5" /LENGTH=265 /DNA_ID=CAMNT_0015371281 /DNA_START=425 /DNA_END=1219 /DNA_ORIENTATION=+